MVGKVDGIRRKETLAVNGGKNLSLRESSRQQVFTNLIGGHALGAKEGGQERGGERTEVLVGARFLQGYSIHCW